MSTTTAPNPALLEKRALLDKVLGEIRIVSDAKWADQGGCVMTKVNKFDSLGKAGIKDGDEILAVNGQPLAGLVSFLKIIEKLGVGAKPVFRVRRAGTAMDVPVELLKKRKLNFDIEEAQVDLERKIAPA